MLKRTYAVCAATALLLLAGSACTSKDVNPTSTPPATVGEAKPLPPDATFNGESVGAAVDVTIVSCPTDMGKQTAKGTVKNSSGQKRDYAIIIAWLKKDSGTPMGSGMVLVKGVEPGASADWKIEADVITKSDICTKNVKAGTLKG